MTVDTTRDLAQAKGTGPIAWCRRWGVRLGWMLLIWALSVAILALAAGAMRLLMRQLGMSQ